MGSVMTKSGLFKDERDTVKRRVRHRDGRLLAGGIGLTTGLGWSDRWVLLNFALCASLMSYAVRMKTRPPRSFGKFRRAL